MKEIKNFYETEMKCCATVVDWATLNKINDEAEYFLAYFGNYPDDDRAAEYAMFGVLGGEGCGERYCIKINNNPDSTCEDCEDVLEQCEKELVEEEDDPCWRCNRPICYGCEHAGK